MEGLFATVDQKSEFYAQVEATQNIWKLLDKLAYILFNENWMIDDHYRGELKENDYFSFEKDDVRLIIVMKESRAFIIVLGLLDNENVKHLIFDNYSTVQLSK